MLTLSFHNSNHILFPSQEADGGYKSQTTDNEVIDDGDEGTAMTNFTYEYSTHHLLHDKIKQDY